MMDSLKIDYLDIDSTTLTSLPNFKLTKDEIEKGRGVLSKKKLVFPLEENADRISHTRAIMLMDKYKVTDYTSTYFILILMFVVNVVMVFVMVQHGSRGVTHERTADHPKYWLNHFKDIILPKNLTVQTSFCWFQHPLACRQTQILQIWCRKFLSVTIVTSTWISVQFLSKQPSSSSLQAWTRIWNGKNKLSNYSFTIKHINQKTNLWCRKKM